MLRPFGASVFNLAHLNSFLISYFNENNVINKNIVFLTQKVFMKILLSVIFASLSFTLTAFMRKI